MPIYTKYKQLEQLDRLKKVLCGSGQILRQFYTENVLPTHKRDNACYVICMSTHNIDQLSLFHCMFFKLNENNQGKETVSQKKMKFSLTTNLQDVYILIFIIYYYTLLS